MDSPEPKKPGLKRTNSALSPTSFLQLSNLRERQQGGSRVRSLFDRAAQAVAKFVPFQVVEERCRPVVPEPVLIRILYWSFPQDEAHIRLYSSPSITAASPPAVGDLPLTAPPGGAPGQQEEVPIIPFGGTRVEIPGSGGSGGGNGTNYFALGQDLMQNGCVDEALQIGFHLSGVVRSLSLYQGESRYYNVSLTFDRCKITVVKCSCDIKDIHWCEHVVALSLYRIRNPDKVRLRLPISESLFQMTKEQLHKFIQYLITEHYIDVLPTAQSLADQLMQPGSEINVTEGAPDPTAGPRAEVEHSWYLDEGQVSRLVAAHLSNHQQSSTDQLRALFSKVREMLRNRDDNGPRLLKLLTEQFLAYPWLGTFRTAANNGNNLQQTARNEKFQQLWDQLGALWVCVVMNPYCEPHQKKL